MIETHPALALVTFIHGYLCSGLQPQQDPSSSEKKKTLLGFSWVNTSPKERRKKAQDEKLMPLKATSMLQHGAGFQPVPVSERIQSFWRITGAPREDLAQLHRNFSPLSAHFVLLRICQPNSLIRMSSINASTQFSIK